MSEKFIPPPDYAVCPKCKEKVDIPKSGKILRTRSKIRQMKCPYCNSQIECWTVGESKL